MPIFLDPKPKKNHYFGTKPLLWHSGNRTLPTTKLKLAFPRRFALVGEEEEEETLIYAFLRRRPI